MPPVHGAEELDAPLGVSLDVSAIPTRPVGAGRYVVELVRALAMRPEVDLNLLSRRDDRARWAGLDASARVVAVAPSGRPLRLAWEDLALGRVVDRLPVAVHHGPHYSLPRWMRRPGVVTVHDCTFIDHPEWHERSKVAFFTRALHRAARHAAVVVCPSETTAERFRLLCSPRGPVLVVPHGVDHERFRPEEPRPGGDAAELDGLGVAEPYVLHVGTLEPRKDVATLLRAFARLAGGHGPAGGGGHELSLVLAGPTGWGTAQVTAAYRDLPEHVRGRIVRLGYVADEALPALLRRAAAFVYASLEEGFGVPVLEALACGAPLVTSQRTVMAEVAGDAAVLSVAGDADSLSSAIEEVLAGGEGRQHRRAAGLRRAAPMTWAASAGGHLAAYRLAAAGTAGRSTGPPVSH